MCQCVCLFEKKRKEKTSALAVAVHVSPKSLRFAELEGTKPTLIDLPTLVLSILSAAFLLPITCVIHHSTTKLNLLFDHLPTPK